MTTIHHPFTVWTPITQDTVYTDRDGDSLYLRIKSNHQFVGTDDNTNDGLRSTVLLPDELQLCRAEIIETPISAQSFYDELFANPERIEAEGGLAQRAHWLADNWSLKGIPE